MVFKQIYEKIIKNCPTCSKAFETNCGGTQEKKFCSKRCASAFRKIDQNVRQENRKIWAREFRKRNPERSKANSKRARQKLKNCFPEKLMLLELRKRARQRGIEFNLEIEDIVIPERCPILGIELVFGKGRVHDASPSMDRIVPSKGYTKGNCFIISSKANRMKQENTIEDFEKIISYIKERM